MKGLEDNFMDKIKPIKDTCAQIKQENVNLKQDLSALNEEETETKKDLADLVLATSSAEEKCNTGLSALSNGIEKLKKESALDKHDHAEDFAALKKMQSNVCSLSLDHQSLAEDVAKMKRSGGFLAAIDLEKRVSVLEKNHQSEAGGEKVR